MDFGHAQQDLRSAYVGGGPGVIVSALAWFIATAFLATRGVAFAFAALFVGGMFIFPLAKLVCRAAFRRANESASNPLGMAALESTIAMIGGFFAAWLFHTSRPELVFPLAAIAVGTHYAIFKTVYGDRTFWLLGAIVTVIGLGDIYLAPLHGRTTLLVALTELAFGLLLTLRVNRPAATGWQGSLAIERDRGCSLAAVLQPPDLPQPRPADGRAL